MKLKKIVNVFQKNYYNAKGNGFGDFLRGTIFMIQVANKYNLEFDIDYNNHMISKFLSKNNNTNYDIDYNMVYFKQGDFYDFNFHFLNNFVEYLNSSNDDTLFMYTNNGVIDFITSEQANTIKNMIIPNEILNIAINNMMTLLDIKEKEYKVIHIRYGDNYILHNNNDTNSFERIYNIISSKILLSDNDMYVIISDNNVLKEALKNKFPSLIIHINDIIHTGEHINNTNSDEYECTKNTLVDFFIMSKSNFIYAMSPYIHRTGFSERCANIFNIGYDFTNYH